LVVLDRSQDQLLEQLNSLLSATKAPLIGELFVDRAAS
jgi:hypothetical protein